MTQPTKTALVLGATGTFGSHAVQALLKHGWRVRALARNPEAGGRQGRSAHADRVDQGRRDERRRRGRGRARAPASSSTPPTRRRYRTGRAWCCRCCERPSPRRRPQGARIVVPGNVYNYAPDAGPAIGEDAPQAPVTRKGKIRVEMEAMLRQAASEGAKVLILRAGDFFGPRLDSWLTTRRARAACARIYRRRAGRRRPRLGLSARPGRDDLARLLDREARPRRLRAFPLPRPLAWPGRRAGRRRPPRHRPAEPADPAVPLAAGLRAFALRRDCSASSSRCATCGSSRSASTTPSWSPSWAPSRTPRSTRRCAARRHGPARRPARRRRRRPPAAPDRALRLTETWRGPLDAAGRPALHARHGRQDPVRQDLGRPRRRPRRRTARPSSTSTCT